MAWAQRTRVTPRSLHTVPPGFPTPGTARLRSNRHPNPRSARAAGREDACGSPRCWPPETPGHRSAGTGPGHVTPAGTRCHRGPAMSPHPGPSSRQRRGEGTGPGAAPTPRPPQPHSPRLRAAHGGGAGGAGWRRRGAAERGLELPAAPALPAASPPVARTRRGGRGRAGPGSPRPWRPRCPGWVLRTLSGLPAAPAPRAEAAARSRPEPRHRDPAGDTDTPPGHAHRHTDTPPRGTDRHTDRHPQTPLQTPPGAGFRGTNAGISAAVGAAVIRRCSDTGGVLTATLPSSPPASASRGLRGSTNPRVKLEGPQQNGAGGRDSLPPPVLLLRSAKGLPLSSGLLGTIYPPLTLHGFCQGTNWQEHQYPLGVLFSQRCNSSFINFLCHAVAHEEVRNRCRGPHNDNGERTLLMTGKRRYHLFGAQ